MTANKPKMKIFATEIKFKGLCNNNIQRVKSTLHNKSVEQASDFTYLIYLISDDRRIEEINSQS
jgi:hypothetical protein